MASSAAAAGSKRTRAADPEDTSGREASFSELPAALLALLSRSPVLHTGMESAGCSALTDALAVLPFSAAEVTRFLAPLVETDDVTAPPPPFTLAACNSASLVFLAPMYLTLRALTTHDAARAWVLVDMLCLDATRRIEDDLVQRYAENPSAEADWRAALTVDGCPACDTLWELVTKKYGALRKQWEAGAPAPAAFGAAPTAEENTGRAVWQQGLSKGVFDSFKLIPKGARAHIGGFLAPVILATLRHQGDAIVLRAALRALTEIGTPERFLDGYLTALARLASDADAVYETCREINNHVVLNKLHDAMCAAGAISLLLSALALHSEHGGKAVRALAITIGQLMHKSPSCCVSVVAGGGHQLFAAALASEVEDVIFVRGLIWALTRFWTLESSGRSAADDIPLLIAALTRHPGEQEIVVNVARALDINRGSAIFFTAVIAAGGIPLLLAALSRHVTASKLVIAVSKLLLGLAGASGDGRASIVACGGIPIILAALASNSGEPPELLLASLLSMLSEGSPLICEAIAAGGGRPLLLALLSRCGDGAFSQLVSAIVQRLPGGTA